MSDTESGEQVSKAIGSIGKVVSQDGVYFHDPDARKVDNSNPVTVRANGDWVFSAPNGGVHREVALDHAKRLIGEGERHLALPVQCESEGCHGFSYVNIRDLTRMEPTTPIHCMDCLRGEAPRWLRQWQEYCPKVFREGPSKTSPKHPEWPAASWDIAKQWTPDAGIEGKRSLYLCGDTGRCKSRMLHWLTYRVIVEQKLDCIVLKGGEFRKRITAAWKDGSAEKYLDSLMCVPVLAWDDFGQDKLGSGPLSDLFSIIDHRYNEGLPMIISSNYPFESESSSLAETLAAQDSNSLPKMNSLVRRLKETCRKIII